MAKYIYFNLYIIYIYISYFSLSLSPSLAYIKDSRIHNMKLRCSAPHNRTQNDITWHNIALHTAYIVLDHTHVPTSIYYLSIFIITYNHLYFGLIGGLVCSDLCLSNHLIWWVYPWIWQSTRVCCGKNMHPLHMPWNATMTRRVLRHIGNMKSATSNL
jgi:hypothetical protein